MIAPEIVMSPQDKCVKNEDRNVAIFLKASGKNIHYQWKRHFGQYEELLSNSDQYEGVNTEQLVITRVVATQDKELYSCEVSNIGGNTTSRKMELSVGEVYT